MRHFLLVTALLLVSAPGFAKDRQRREVAGSSQADQQATEREARVACLNGDYAKGVALLSGLFVDSKDPNYLFNQGRCYEQNQRFEEAIGRFREYLRVGGISASDREAAERHIGECEALQAKRDAAAGPSVIPPAAPLPPAPEVAPAAPLAEAPAVSVASPAPAPSSPGSGLRLGGIVVASIGAAALVGGIVLNLKANSLADSIDPPSHTFSRDTESTRSSYETLAWISYGVGAAGIAAGAVLYVLGWSSSGDSKVAIFPMLAPGLAGAGLRSTF